MSPLARCALSFFLFNESKDDRGAKLDSPLTWWKKKREDSIRELISQLHNLSLNFDSLEILVIKLDNQKMMNCANNTPIYTCRFGPVHWVVSAVKTGCPHGNYSLFSFSSHFLFKLWSSPSFSSRTYSLLVRLRDAKLQSRLKIHFDLWQVTILGLTNMREYLLHF